MNRTLSFFLLFGFIFAILTCSENLTSVDLIPDKVVLIAGTSDTTVVEQGMDAIPEENAILIQWHSLDDQTIKSYEVWRSTDQLLDYENIAEVTISDSSYIDKSVQFYKKYFYYVVAVNEDNKKGESSDTLSYILLKKAIHLNPQGEISEQSPKFSWEDPNGASEYIIRVFDPLSNDCIWLEKISSTYSNREEVQYNFNNTAKLETLKSGNEYYWRIDVVGSDTYSGAGSESNWTVIRIWEN